MGYEYLNPDQVPGVTLNQAVIYLLRGDLVFLALRLRHMIIMMLSGFLLPENSTRFKDIVVTILVLGLVLIDTLSSYVFCVFLYVCMSQISPLGGVCNTNNNC